MSDLNAMMRSLDSALVEHQTRAESPRRASGGRRAVGPGLAPPPPRSSLASLAGIPPISRGGGGAPAPARARPAWLENAENVDDLGSLLEGLDAPGGGAANPPKPPASNADALTDELDGALAMLDRTLAARDPGAAARGAPPAALDGGAIDMAAALALGSGAAGDRDAMLRAHRLLAESGVAIGVWDLAQQRETAPPRAPPSGAANEPELKLLGAWRDQLWQRCAEAK